MFLIGLKLTNLELSSYSDFVKKFVPLVLRIRRWIYVKVWATLIVDNIEWKITFQETILLDTVFV